MMKSSYIVQPKVSWAAETLLHSDLIIKVVKISSLKWRRKSEAETWVKGKIGKGQLLQREVDWIMLITKS